MENIDRSGTLNNILQAEEYYEKEYLKNRIKELETDYEDLKQHFDYECKYSEFLIKTIVEMKKGE